jgi:hypothetical protein
MVSPSAMALAAITVMLWILWSDTLRGRKPAPVLYAVRIALYLIISGVMLVNMFRFPHLFAGSARALTIFAVIIGFVGAGYFGRRLVRRV